jgi:hypothetical protein
VRQSALQASWQRDRWVAKRRIALRWLVWLSWRYGLPVLATATALAIAWRVVLAWPFAAPPESGAASHPAAVHAPAFPETAPDDTPMKLRFDPAWPVAPPKASQTIYPKTPTQSDLDAAAPSPPHLKPENWLHSKEP